MIAKDYWQRRKGWRLCVWLALLAAIGTMPGLAQTWQSAQHGPAETDLNAVYFITGKPRGWIVGDNGFVSRTDDNGKTWTPQKFALTTPINDIHFITPDNGYLLSGPAIWASADGGTTWQSSYVVQPKEVGGTSAELYSIRFSSKKNGWAVGSISASEKRKGVITERVIDSLVLRTEDGGNTWRRWRVPSSNELIHLDVSGDKRAWIVGAEGTILYTNNNGDSWQMQRSNTQETLYHIDFRNDKNGLAVGKKGTLLRTLDGGETWIPVMLPVTNTLLSVALVSDDEAWIVGRGGLILRTSDSGLTWIVQDTTTKNNLFALYFDKKTGYAVGADGLVMRYERAR